MITTINVTRLFPIPLYKTNIEREFTKQEQGGVLANPTDIHRYCELDYGGKFVLKEVDK